MSNNKVIDLLSQALSKGITIFKEGGKLKFNLEEGKVLDPEFVQLLKSNKDEILNFLDDELGAMEDIKQVEDRIQPFDRRVIDKIPLSFAQERLWFIDQLAGTYHYHMPYTFIFDKQLEKVDLEGILNQLVNRHEVFRTLIREEKGEAFQTILPENCLKMNFTNGVQEENLEKLIGEEIKRDFDLANEHKIRARLVELPDEYLLILIVHHIVSDAWSTKIFMKDLMELYRARVENRSSNLLKPNLSYLDYAVWQRNYLKGEVLEKKLAYWKSKLAGLVPVELPIDFPRPVIQSKKGNNINFIIDQSLSRALLKICQVEKVTPFIFLLTAFKVLLYKYTGQTDICVGSPMANRRRKELEKVVGFFVNMVALRSDLSDNPGFLNLLAKVKTTTVESYDYQDAPFEKVVESVLETRDQSRSPVFQIAFTTDKANTKMGVENKGTSVDELASNESTQGQMGLEARYNISKFDLTLKVLEEKNQLQFYIEYCTDLFTVNTIQLFGEHFTALLKSIAKNPTVKIDALSMISPAEEKRLLSEFNDTESIYPKEKTLIEGFLSQVPKSAEKIAVAFESSSLTYQELDHQSNQLANYLQVKGVNSGDKIGLLSFRSCEMIVSILGILKCGAAYVPLNISHPKGRFQSIVDNAKISYLVYSHKEILDRIDEIDCHKIALSDAVNESNKMPSQIIDARSPAYVMYTSGTTGKPKGIVVNHQNVIKLVYESKHIQVTKEDRVLQWSNYAFDGSIYDIFSSLLNGASIYMIKESDAPNPDRLSDLIKSNEISVCFITTALFNTFVDYNLEVLKKLRLLLFGGELVSSAHVHKAVEALGDDKIVHVYGPTETTTYASYLPLKLASSDIIPIGRPLSNTQIYIVNPSGRLAGIGVIGEIWIGGDGVADGYLGRPELTAEKFIPDLFSQKENARLYKTGDLAKWRMDGTIEFIGRRDDQVKIRGHRIELGEVQAALDQCKEVRQNVVLIQKDDSNNKTMVAYIVPEGKFDREQIKAKLGLNLAEYMIPNILIELEEMPLNSNGKIDKSKLPLVDFTTMISKDYVAARNDTEIKLVGIWEDLLKVDQIGIHDNFFNIGGHSLMAARLIARIRDEFVLDIPIKAVFEFESIAKMGEYIQLMKGPSDDFLYEKSESFEL